jgi:hypothetical protein
MSFKAIIFILFVALFVFSAFNAVKNTRYALQTTRLSDDALDQPPTLPAVAAITNGSRAAAAATDSSSLWEHLNQEHSQALKLRFQQEQEQEHQSKTLAKSIKESPTKQFTQQTTQLKEQRKRQELLLEFSSKITSNENNLLALHQEDSVIKPEVQVELPIKPTQQQQNQQQTALVAKNKPETSSGLLESPTVFQDQPLKKNMTSTTRMSFNDTNYFSSDTKTINSSAAINIITPENVIWTRNWQRNAVQCRESEGVPAHYYSNKDTEIRHPPPKLVSWLSNCTGYIWVRSSTSLRKDSNIAAFAKHVVPVMTKPFSLITTDGDVSIPSRIRDFKYILDSPLCRAWYTQNYDGTVVHPKFRPIPIGFDFHTNLPGLWSRPNNYQNNLRRMLEMRRVAMSSPSPSSSSVDRRSLSVLVPPWSKNRHPDRKACHAALDMCNITHDQLPRMKIDELWGNYTRYRFALSPFGNGLDTYRLWELLFFGVVPITKTSSLDILYKGLPVVIVNEYSDLCDSGYLEKAWEQRVKHVWPAPDKAFTMDWWLNERYA